MSAPRRVRARRRPVALVIGLAVAFLVTGCGEDVPSKTEFTTKLNEVTGGSVDEELGACVYDEMVDSDGGLLRKAMSTRDLSDAENEKLSVILARCVIARSESDAPAEDDGGSDTTSGDEGG